MAHLVLKAKCGNQAVCFCTLVLPTYTVISSEHS